MPQATKDKHVNIRPWNEARIVVLTPLPVPIQNINVLAHIAAFVQRCARQVEEYSWDKKSVWKISPLGIEYLQTDDSFRGDIYNIPEHDVVFPEC